MPEYFFHLLFLSICLFQIVFIILQWLLYKRVEYGYYLLYLVSCSIYILFRVNWVIQILPCKQNVLTNEILDKPFIIFAIWMYIRFGYHFLNLKQLQPKVYIAAKRLEIGYTLLVISLIILLPFKLNYNTAATIFLVTTLTLAILATIVIIQLLQQKNLLNNFLVSGGLCITIGGAVGPVIGAFLPNMGEGNLVVFYGLEIGIFIEMMLLNMGFLLKNKILQQQVIKAQQQIIKQYQNKNKPQNVTH